MRRRQVEGFTADPEVETIKVTIGNGMKISGVPLTVTWRKEHGQHCLAMGNGTGSPVRIPVPSIKGIVVTKRKSPVT